MILKAKEPHAASRPKKLSKATRSFLGLLPVPPLLLLGTGQGTWGLQDLTSGSCGI